jgi:hypothetical protein
MAMAMIDGEKPTPQRRPRNICAAGTRSILLE